MESVEGRAADEHAESERRGFAARAFALGPEIVERASQACRQPSAFIASSFGDPRERDAAASRPGHRRR